MKPTLPAARATESITRRSRSPVKSHRVSHSLLFVQLQAFMLCYVCSTSYLTAHLHSSRGLLSSWNMPTIQNRERAHPPHQPAPWSPASHLQHLTSNKSEPLTGQSQDSAHNCVKPEGSMLLCLGWQHPPQAIHLLPSSLWLFPKEESLSSHIPKPFLSFFPAPHLLLC